MNLDKVVKSVIVPLRKATKYSASIKLWFFLSIISSSQAFAYFDTPADFGWTGYLSGLPSAEEACRSHLPTLIGPNGYFIFESVDYLVRDGWCQTASNTFQIRGGNSVQ